MTEANPAINASPPGNKVSAALLLGASIAAVWIALAIGLAVTRAPWSNEAWTAIPALNLAQRGSMGTTVLE